MPNPMKKFFRRPAVRRCRKVASKTFRKIFPDRGYSDSAHYRDRAGLAEWVSKQQEYGFQPNPLMGRGHSLEMHQGRSRGRPYQPQGGYLPCGPRQQVSCSAFDPSYSMSNVSEVTDDSRYSARRAEHHAFQSPCKPSPERLPAGGTGGNETSAHRELMFMIDQLEQAELEKIQRDLRQFQTSRRRLMFNLSSLSATSSPPARLMQPVPGPLAPTTPGCAQIMPAP